MTGFTRAARAEDLPAIDRLFRTSFGGTFGHLYSAEDLATFLADFTPQAWRRIHDDPRFAFRLAELEAARSVLPRSGRWRFPPTIVPMRSS